MEKIFMRNLMAAVLILSSTYAFSCQFNTDCAIGSKCVKGSGIYGYCMGGMNPGNSNDSQPATDLMGGGGYTCSFSTDCDPGYRCAKSGLKGTCVRR